MRPSPKNNLTSFINSQKIVDSQQKKDKIKNILQTLKKEKRITVNPNSSAREWIMSNLDEI